ncbi:MAG: FdrA family protein [Solirubrobacteraceae bacterium]
MHERVIVSRGAYHDSVALMLVSKEAAAVPGALDVAVAMATPLNLELIARSGFDLTQCGELTTGDLVIAIRAADDDALERIRGAVAARLGSDRGDNATLGGISTPGVLMPPRDAESTAAARSLTAAARSNRELNVAMISVPGEHAAYEAARALDAGLHVFCFSSGVPVEHERALKLTALDRGLLFMGPDCGTAIIDGVRLGFANVVQRGPVGIVGASGSGIQELCCLLDAASVGISHAIGVGGRDLSAEIGGVMTRQALELLASDDSTEAIVVVSKPGDPAVVAAVIGEASVSGKPIVRALVGESGIEQAARDVARSFGVELPVEEPPEAEPLRGTPGLICGLYSGGTLCLEAKAVVAAAVDEPELHAFIDFGSEELTRGRAHPMIDPTLRLERFAREASDPAVGAIMLDLVLGYGAHPDPAEQYAPVIAAALRERPALSVVVSLCGTDRDPQGLERQREQLSDAGALVCRSAAGAARAALAAVGERQRASA